ncbi:MAG: primosomal protein N' [Bacteroidales bacterium]|jgi:primosomal protein N' (replication factor Y)|nr:primosomal protein N' [Bacteroidales bacterium]
MPQQYADIIIPLAVNDLFTYSVPADLQSAIKCGVRVIVQFGSRKFYTGIVAELHNRRTGKYDIKGITALLDTEPTVTPQQVELWKWMADYYCTALGDVFRAALPAALKLESHTKISLNPLYPEQAALSDEEHFLLNVLHIQEQIDIQDIQRITGHKTPQKLLKSLLEKNAILVEERIAEQYHPKSMAIVRLHPSVSSEQQFAEILDSLTKAAAQKRLFERFLAETVYNSPPQPHVSKKELLLDGSATALQSLIVKRILQLEEIEVSRLAVSAVNEQHSFELTEHQQAAFDRIMAATQPVLLHGVTSSGKTEIYIRLLEQQLAAGKQSLYLVPEIGLSTQLIERLRKHFGNQVGVYHSGFSDAERVEIWQKVLRNDAESFRIILGTRTATLLPFSNLGQIVVDEEHDSSYKQVDPAPRYNARDVALMMGRIHNARVVLGTATPSFESYYNVKTGKYTLVELFRRFGDMQMPEIVVANMRRAIRKNRMKSLFTPELYEEISRALTQHEQVILFQNRRGFAPYLQCPACGWIPACKRCDVNLTFHKKTGMMMCHYCGNTQHTPTRCPACGNQTLDMKGLGTEKIEEELAALFPNARIERMDVDAMRTKHAFENLLYRFATRRTDILIGTQMVTKGLDFEHVSVVGIPDADAILNFPDFRAFERAFQLLAQVSGRAGRKHTQGKVIIQTTLPDHPVLRDVAANNFGHLYDTQMEERQCFHYPPYFRLLKIVVKHQDSQLVDNGAQALADRLHPLFGTALLGPEYPLITRVKNLFRKEIWIKLARNNRLQQSKQTIIDEIGRLKATAGFSGLIIYADVDPL